MWSVVLLHFVKMENASLTDVHWSDADKGTNAREINVFINRDCVDWRFALQGMFAWKVNALWLNKSQYAQQKKFNAKSNDLTNQHARLCSTLSPQHQDSVELHHQVSKLDLGSNARHARTNQWNTFGRKDANKSNLVSTNVQVWSVTQEVDAWMVHVCRFIQWNKSRLTCVQLWLAWRLRLV